MVGEEIRDRRKWRYVYTVFPILALGEGITGKAFYRRSQKRYEMIYAIISREIMRDLDYLEGTDTLKLSPQQRLSLRPLIAKLDSVDLGQGCVFNEIYSRLTPQQYSAILNRDPHPADRWAGTAI
ncbi:MAG: hypothetical protein HPY50_21280 [Firmicutes bacterium]|nr:hypothetical protein [Bacillota bacterium]